MITVKGIAQNAKGGAVVTSKEIPYYIEGMFAWPAELLDQRVKVTGKLLRVDHDADAGTDADGIHIQSMAGEQLVLQDATWEKIR